MYEGEEKEMLLFSTIPDIEEKMSEDKRLNKIRTLQTIRINI